MSHVQKVAYRPNPQKVQRRQFRLSGWIRFVCARLLFLTMLQPIVAHQAFASCSAPKNPIEAENCLPGNPSSEWGIAGAGSANIQGFATDISFNAGQTVFFKVTNRYGPLLTQRKIFMSVGHDEVVVIHDKVADGGAVMTLGSDGVIGYLIDSNDAFLFSTDSSVLSGFGELQAAGPLTNTAVKGTYAGVATSPVGFGVFAFSGEFTADGASPTGAITGTEDVGTPDGPISGSSFSASYSISSSPTNGRGTVTLTAPSAGNAVAYVVSPSKFVMVPLSDPNPSVWVFEQPLPDAILSGLTLNSASVVGGAQSSTGMATLSGPAPAGGAQVTVSSSSAAVSVPSTLTVPAGATSATFTANTSIVLVSTSVTISAAYSNTTQTASLSVLL